jgi:hypothetical protein
MLVLMPAPTAKARSMAALVPLALLLVIIARMAADSRQPLSPAAGMAVAAPADRLALICTFLC